MKVLIAQRNPIVGDLDGNRAKILESLNHGRKRKADIVLFSEMVLCGYPPRDLLFHRSFIDSMMIHLEHLVKASTGITAIVGMVRSNVERGERKLFNSAAVIHDGHLLGFQDKWLLPTYDLFNERRYFEPGKEMKIWDIRGKRVGITICEDIWQHSHHFTHVNYGRDPISALAECQIDLLLNLSASPYQMQQPYVRKNVCIKAASTLQCPILMCCQVGANDQIIFDGHSLYVDTKREVCHIGKGFVEDEIFVNLDDIKDVILCKNDVHTDLLSALILGVKDYFTKCSFKKALLGISGGIDSSLVAYIAAQALGPNNIIGISMPSYCTPMQSRNDAKEQAKRLQIQCIEIPIIHPFDSFLHLLDPYLQGEKREVAKENLQARIRGTILMALSNMFGYILLSTGNKSELAVGYSTLYGDMCGGVGVIGDVTKTQVYELCHHINKVANAEVILHTILQKPPSAELRPNQVDIDSLPPYDIVDRVLKEHVENYLSIDEISERYKIPYEQVIELIRRIYGAEYKRRQGPITLRTSRKSFGIGRYYPIVQRWF